MNIIITKLHTILFHDKWKTGGRIRNLFLVGEKVLHTTQCWVTKNNLKLRILEDYGIPDSEQNKEPGKQ